VALPLQEYTNYREKAIDLVVKMNSGWSTSPDMRTIFLKSYPGDEKEGGLARAMALDPAVLFFDEPSAGLDPITSAELDSLIKSIRQG